MASFSAGSRLHVAYTRRPPGFTRLAAALRMEAWVAFSCATLSGDWRSFRSGLRRRVPRPEQGASTRTRSILPASRLMRLSFSEANSCGCTLDSPERARRGLRLARRFSEISNAYRRPVDAIIAPSSRVLPPAPAQKSTTISPRRGASSRPSSWLPSSCTSIWPLVNSGILVSAGLPFTRRPNGDSGVASALMPAACSAASASSRRVFRVFTRKSSGAGCCMARPSVSRVSSSMPPACSASTTQSGSSARWARLSSGSSALSSPAHLRSASVSASESSRRLWPRTRTSEAISSRLGVDCGAVSAVSSAWRRSTANTDSAIKCRSCWPSLWLSRKNADSAASAGLSQGSTRRSASTAC